MHLQPLRIQRSDRIMKSTMFWNCKSTFNDMRSFTVDSVSLTSSCANLKFTSVFQLAQVLDESAGVSPTFKFGNLFLDETLGRDMGCSRLPMSY